MASISNKVAGDTIDEGDWNGIVTDLEAGVPDIFTTKGDLAVATGADAAARLAVGADDSILVPDSGEATGLAWQIQPSCQVYNNSDLDPTPSTWWTVTFDNERWDTNQMHSTVSNTDRLTVPTGGAGEYGFEANIQFDTSGVGGDTGYYGLRFLLNGSTVIKQYGPAEITPNTYDMGLVLSGRYQLTVAQYVILQVFTTHDINILAANNFSPVFGALWLRRS